jgi:hypothetical protein
VGVPVQGEPGNANGNRGERRPTASQPHGRAPTPPARAPEPNNDQRANEGAKVNTGADVPPLFWRASQNLAAATMLLRSYPEPATSKERRVRQQLKMLLEVVVAQQAESSAPRQRSERGRAGAPSAHDPNPPPP